MRIRVVLAVFAALAVIAGAGVYIAVRSLSNGLPLHLVTQQCIVSADGKATLEPDQMANAATIAAVGIRRGLPTRAVVIALSAALQESKLENLAGGDRDSIGLFQQRPSQDWGTPQEISNPRYAAGAFYTALMRVRNWQGRSIAEAAQAVQRSADGSAYAQWEAEAQILANALSGDVSGAVACTITAPPAARGPAAAGSLAQSLTADWGEMDTVTDNSLPGLKLTVNETRNGWQIAHWLVAHSVDQNIKSVRYGDQEWTAKAGTWSRASGDRTVAAGDQIIAAVYSQS
ncbi:hypothetical protein [Rugosimonospora africana]|uniref:hypothetical protein n=1 Tax=Rugosimonospora africana TaxID=556532 RepID=UPI00194047CA|nr:hypothetical protein [Rugosimonospora africana]